MLYEVITITGTAYAGKSTMVAMLAEKYGLIPCGENYHMQFCNDIIEPTLQPNMCYFQTMKDWSEFLNRTPEEYVITSYSIHYTKLYDLWSRP